MSTIQRFENLKLIRDKEIRNSIEGKIDEINDLFIKNDMKNGMVFGFLQDCINGQILISLKKDGDHHTNSIHDFYIDTRVGFRGTRRVRDLIEEITEDLMKIVDRDQPKIVVTDIVRRNKYVSNIALQKYSREKTFRVMEIIYDLKPNYFGYYIVETSLKPFKKNWIYAGSDDLEKIKELP